MEEEPPWEEALDLDDSDFRSVLRPCKRLHPSTAKSTTIVPQPPTPTISTPKTLTLISQRLRPSQSGYLSTQFNSSPSISLSFETETETLAQSSSSRRSIPGPAGAVQAALKRRAQCLESESEGDMPPVISTQEYLRKVVESGEGSGSEFDEDFKSCSWVTALEFSGKLVDGIAASTTVHLGSIKSHSTQKLAKVVAMIKSCTPNGFGDLMVTLKDPSGSASASIHRSVLMQCHHGRDLSVGAVLVLQKVSFFTRLKDCYLNITKSNVVKIFPKDFEPLAIEVSGSAAANESRVPKSVVKSAIAHTSASVEERGATAWICNQVDGTAGSFGRLPLNAQTERTNYSQQVAALKTSGSITRGIGIHRAATFKVNEPTGDASERGSSTHTNIRAEAHVMSESDHHQSTLPHKQTEEADRAVHKVSSTAVKSIGAVKQMQSLTSISTLPMWTEEQLKELLVDD